MADPRALLNRRSPQAVEDSMGLVPVQERRTDQHVPPSRRVADPRALPDRRCVQTAEVVTGLVPVQKGRDDLNRNVNMRHRDHKILSLRRVVDPRTLLDRGCPQAVEDVLNFSLQSFSIYLRDFYASPPI